MTSRIPIGWAEGQLFELDRQAFRRHWLTAGPTGSGKTAAVLGRIARDLTHPTRPPTNHVVIDPKGELAQDLVRFLPLLARSGHFGPDDVNVIAPWRDLLVPLNLCADQTGGLSRDLRASVVVARIERFIGEAMGNRMKPLLHPVVVAVVGAGGSLKTVLETLERDEVRLALAKHEPDESVRRYLADGIEREPAATRQAIVARLRHMMELTPIRRMLAARGCVSGAELLSARVTVIDLGSAPAGQEEVAYALSGWLVSLVTAALFARPERSPQVRLCVDEAQKVVRYAAGDLERTLQEIRWRGATLSLITQSIGQIADASVRTALLANVGNIFALAPRDEELRLLSRYLPPPSGRAIHPEFADRLMTESEERRHIEAHFRNLPSRVAVFVNTDQGVAKRLEAPNLPFARMREMVNALPQSERRAFERGAIARAAGELAQEEATLEIEIPESHVGTPRGQSRKRTPRVELPDD